MASNPTYIVDQVVLGELTTGMVNYALTFATFNAPITSPTNDTPVNWSAFGNVACWYGTAGQLTGQPSQYGILLSMAAGSDVSQLWFTQSSGKIYRRSGNANGWSTSWKEVLQEGTSVIPIESGGTNATSKENARTNLGLGTVAVENIVPIEKGGTNAATKPEARAQLEVDKAVVYTTFSGTSLTAAAGTEYVNNTAIGSLAVTLPTAARGVIFGVNFTANASFTGVTFSSTVKQVGDVVTAKSKRYNMIIWYEGSAWWCAAKTI